MSECLFCKIAAGEIPADILYEDDEVIVFRDIAPQAPHHFLVIPKIHVSGPAAVNADHDALCGKMMRVAAQLAAQHQIGDGYRLVMNNGATAGQTVFHLHMHVLGGRPMHWPPG